MNAVRAFCGTSAGLDSAFPRRSLMRRPAWDSASSRAAESGVKPPHSKLLLLVVLFVGASQLQAAFLVDNFNSYSPGSNVNALANGWGGAAGAIVTNIDYLGVGAGNSAYVPPDAVVSNTVNQPGATYPRIWSETCVYQVERLDLLTAPLPSSNSMVMLGVDTGGHLAAYDPAVTNWVSYTNDVWGTNMTLTASDWARISVLHNFSNHTAAVFLNTHLMKSGLAFMTNLDIYGHFQLDSGVQTNALLDNAYVSNAVPPSLTNVDLDMDGMADALEVQTYGDVTTWRRLTNTVSATGSGTINPLGPFTVISGSNVVYSLASPEAWSVGGLTNNAVDVRPLMTSTGFRSWSYTVNVTADIVINAAFVRDGFHYVPGDHSTITDALTAAYAGGYQGDHVVVSNGTYNETLVLSNGVILVGTNLGVNATNLTVNGTMTVVTGQVSTASGALTVTGQVSVAAGGLLTISNTVANFGGLMIGGGGLLHMAGGTLIVGGYTNTGDFTLSLVTNMVTSAGNGSISPAGTNTMISTWSNVTYTLSGSPGYVAGSLTNNGVVTNFAGTKTAIYTDPAANITNNQIITAAFVYNGVRYVPGDYGTVTDALAAAYAGGHLGDHLVVSNGAYNESLVLSNGVILVGTNLGVNATNLTVNGTMTVVTGQVSTASGELTVMGQVSVAAGGLLTISNTVANFGGLTIGGGGLLHMVGGTLIVGGYTNTGDFTLSLVTNMVTSAGNGSISPSGTNTMISTWSDVTYSLSGSPGYVAGSLTNNGVVTNFAGTKTAIYTDPASNITNNQIITAAFAYNGVRYVPGDYTTITGAQAAAYAAGHLGDQLVVSNGTYNESLVLSNGVILIGTNLGVNATNLTVNGAMSVVTGSVSGVGLVTVTGQVSVADGGLLTVSNAAVNFGDLIFGGAGAVKVVNGSVAIQGTTRTGTFTLDQNWRTTLVPVVLDFSDGFELYASNTDVTALGFHGWSASEAGAVVQGPVAAQSSTQSVLIPSDIVVSNTVEAGHTSVWTEVYVNSAALMDPETQPLVNSNLTVQFFVGTNGYLTLYNPTLPGWDVCSNNVVGGKVDEILVSQWIRIDVYQNFSNHTAAVFLNDQLLRDQVPFISNTVSECHGFSLEGGHGGTNYLDTVKVWRSEQGLGLLGDVDTDGMADALEIQTYGNVTTWRRFTNTVSSAGTGTGTISPSGAPFTVAPGSNMIYALTADEACVVGAVTNNGADGAASLTGAGTRHATYTDSNISDDRVITAWFSYTGYRYVPEEHTTITGALAAAYAGGHLGDHLVVSNGVYNESLVLSNGVILVGTNLGVNATNLTVNGAMSVVTGQVSTASGELTVTGQVTIAAGGLLTISNTVANFGGLTIGGGGLLHMAGGTLIVGGYTNTGDFTLSLVTNMAASSGNGSISPSGTNTMISTWSNVTYTLSGDPGYVAGSLTNNGVVTNFADTKTAIYTDPASNITNNQIITAAFVYNGVRYVPGDYTSITGAQAAAYAAGHFGDHLVVSNGTYNESLVLSNGVILVGTNMGVNATNLTVDGAMSVVTGSVSIAGVLTVTGQVSVVAGGLLTATNSALNFGDLSIGSGGLIKVVNGSVTINGTTWTGDFTLDQNWRVTLTPVVLDFTDNFESYASNTDVIALGYHGWSASAAGAVVQGAAGNQSVLMPTDMVVSNTVEAGHTSVWTEVYIKAGALMEPDSLPLVNSNLTVQLFVGTNGYLTLYNRTLQGWDVCSNNVRNKEVAKVSAAQWLRISVYQNFSNHTAAVFLDDQLLREQVPFISNTVAECHGFSLAGGHGGTIYLDTVKVWRSEQGMGLVGDCNLNGSADSREIERAGVLAPYQCGAVFKIR